MRKQKISTLKLPQPEFKEKMTVEEAIKQRRTVRSFSSKEITIPAISRLLWALQGITYVENMPNGKKVFHRGAPSAGRTFPLEVYVAFSKGLFHYKPEKHVLHKISDKDTREKLSEAFFTALNKVAIKTAPLTIILAADNERALKATPLFESAVRFVHLEAGHATQNLILQAVSFGLGVCTITSYNVATVYEVLKLPLNHRPIYLLPVGFPREANS